jgi:hypothetical protein
VKNRSFCSNGQLDFTHLLQVFSNDYFLTGSFYFKIYRSVLYLRCGDGYGDVYIVPVDDLLTLDDSVHCRLLLQCVRAGLEKFIDAIAIHLAIPRKFLQCVPGAMRHLTRL